MIVMIIMMILMIIIMIIIIMIMIGPCANCVCTTGRQTELRDSGIQSQCKVCGQIATEI